MFIEIVSPKYGNKETVISLSDLERVKEFPNTWSLVFDRKMNKFYVGGKLTICGKRKFITLHRWILQPNENSHVDHLNYNTLDNRFENLKECSHAENTRRKSRNSINSVGARGVYWSKQKQKYVGQVRSFGNHYHVGQFDTLEEASEATEKKRRELWGDVDLRYVETSTHN